MTVQPISLSSTYRGALYRAEVRAAQSDAPADPEREFQTLLARTLDRIAAIKVCWDYWKEERDAAREAAEFLEKDQASETWLKPNPGEDYKAMRLRKELITVDVANKLLRDVATTYQSEPRRTVVLPEMEVDEADEDLAAQTREEREAQKSEINDWLGAHLFDFGEWGWDQQLLWADRRRAWHGSLVALPRFVLEDDLSGDSGVEVLVRQRHEFEVLPDEDDGRKALAFVFPVRNVREKLKGYEDRWVDVTVFHYYDDRVFCRLKGWAIDEEQGKDSGNPRWREGLFVHDLGYAPVVPLREELVQDRYHPPPKYPNLMRMCMAVNKLETELAFTAKLAGGVYYADGQLKEKALGADVIITGDAGVSLSQVSSGAPLDAIGANIQRQIDNLAMSFGAAPGSFVMDPQAAKSGIAISLEQSATEAIRQERVPGWVKAEQRLYRASLDVYRVWGGDALLSEMPEALRDRESTPDLAVQHMPPPTQLTAKERRERLDWERKYKMVSREDMLRESRPELTEDEIAARLMKADEDPTLSTPSEQPQNPAQAMSLSNPFAGLSALRRPVTDVARTGPANAGPAASPSASGGRGEDDGGRADTRANPGR